MFNYRIIYGPSPATVDLLKNKVTAKNRERIGERLFGAIGIFQTTLPDLYFYADIGQKSGEILMAEIPGNCPQTLGSIAFFGDVSAVETAMKAVLRQQEAGGSKDTSY